MPRVLSKSRFLAGEQCTKRLWYEVNRRDEIPPYDADTLAVFEQGQEVGAIAQGLFPGGIEVLPDERDWSALAAATREAMAARVPLYEAGFVHRGGAARVDILAPAPEGAWDLLEVKSTTKVKDEHRLDLAFQSWVLRGTGVALRNVELVHLDPDYVLDGELDPERFFVRERLNEEVEAILPAIEPALERLRAVAAAPSEPIVPIGYQCDHPHACPLIPRCWAFLPERPVTSLYSDRAQTRFALLARGIERLADIPADVELTEKQQIQRQVVRAGRPHVDRAAIRRFLAGLEPPLDYLDFETINPAIPIFQGTRPFQHVPFQFSLDRQQEIGGEIERRGFLAAGTDDPRPELLRRLREALLPGGSVLAYYATFERSRLSELARDFPAEAAWIEPLHERIVDLHEPFKAFAYYHPDQDGSASVKAVLPALTGAGYEELPIAEGRSAARAFLRITFGPVDPGERARVRADLERYCALDTEGMVRIVAKLAELAGG